MNEIETILQHKEGNSKRLYDLYRFASEGKKDEVVLALIGKVIGEYEMRKVSCKKK